MRRISLLIGLIPVLGLAELGLHQYFGQRAPVFGDYAALSPVLSKLKQPGTPVVVAPAWAEPLVRQAAPQAFPIGELTRPTDSGFASFLEVSLLGQHAPELAAFPVQSEERVGPFRVSLRRNPQHEPVLFDFVTAVDLGEVEIFTRADGGLTPCQLAPAKHADTGGLHGHVAYPKQRHKCAGGRLVGVTLIDDEQYRARRCVLAQAPASGSLLLRFSAVPRSQRLLGFGGFSYFLERDATAPQAELSASEGGQRLGQFSASGAGGWSRFEWLRSSVAGPVELEVRALQSGVEFCFALEAR